MGLYIYNSDEIKKIRDACVITANILDEIGHLIDDGTALGDVDAQVRVLCRQNGAKPAFLGYNGFPAAICASVNSVVIHGIPDRKTRLHSGDIVGVDLDVFLVWVLSSTFWRYIGYRSFNNLKECLLNPFPRDVAGNRYVGSRSVYFVDFIDIDDSSFGAFNVKIGVL